MGTECAQLTTRLRPAGQNIRKLINDGFVIRKPQKACIPPFSVPSCPCIATRERLRVWLRVWKCAAAAATPLARWTQTTTNAESAISLKRRPTLHLSPAASWQIHCRYRANELLEAKRKGRHTGTGACVSRFFRLPAAKQGLTIQLRSQASARVLGRRACRPRSCGCAACACCAACCASATNFYFFIIFTPNRESCPSHRGGAAIASYISH